MNSVELRELFRVREVVQQVRTLVALQKTWVQVPSTHMVVRVVSSRDALSPSAVPAAGMQNTHTLIRQINFFKERMLLMQVGYTTVPQI